MNNTFGQQFVRGTVKLDRAWQISQELLAIASPDGTIEAVNPMWTEVLGWEPHEVIGQRFVAFTHPDDLDATLVAFARIFEERLVVPYEYRLRHKDGSYRCFGWTGAFENGMVYASGRDVTRDHEREAILRDAQDFARLALSAVGGVGAWTYEVATDLFFYDADIADLYAIDPVRGPSGIPRVEFLANVHPDDQVSLKSTMVGGLSVSGDLELEYRIQHPDGSIRWVLSRGHTYHDEQGKPVRRTGVGVEMTRQRQTEEALRQSQKMEAVGQLTGGLAHDFNNLLAGMMGNLELLQMRVARGRLDDLDRFINAAQGAGRRAATLTQRLLAFSRRQTLDPKPTDVNRLLVGLHELLNRTVGATVAIEVVQAAELWTTQIDGPQLENALINLCVNGRDAMPGGGKLTIETANTWIDDCTGQERDLPPGQYVCVCVTDTGTGMSAETIRRAFEPFFTTKPIGQGTGLGLSMIYGFARQSGGQVRIHSEMDQGTTVSIFLPRHDGPAQVDDHDGEATLTESTDGQTVLVVDDEATIRHLIDEVLDDLGYTVIGAADGAAGIKVLQSSARIELLITDVGLPNGMNGRQVADEARRLRPGIKVLFITGFAENAAVGNGHLEPGMELLTKPFTLEALSTKVADMLRKPGHS